MYAHFNARDIDAVLKRLTDDVVWANGMDGGYVHGREGVREYWSRQFELVRSTVRPIEIEIDQDGRTVVDVRQTVRSADSDALLSDGRVAHIFTFEDDKIARFDIASTTLAPRFGVDHLAN